MRRIWFLWLGIAYVMIHGVSIPLQIANGQYFFAVVGVIMCFVVIRAIWPRLHYITDPDEYK